MSTGCADLAGTVVLLEGSSDVAAVRAVAATYGVTEQVHRCHLIDMGGVTNIRRHLVSLGRASVPVRVIGMCDAAETKFIVRAVQGMSHEARHGAALVEHGFQVCVADLEDELIRAWGPERVVGVLSTLGLGRLFEMFQRQPAWRERPLHDQLHRFAGAASGRKALLARALSAGLAPAEVPAPLRRLVAAMADEPLPAR